MGDFKVIEMVDMGMVINLDIVFNGDKYNILYWDKVV